MIDVLYDSINKIFTYYDFKFMSNYIFLIIILINSFKAFLRYKEIVISGIQFKGFINSEILISLLSLIGIFSEAYFQKTQKTLYDIFSYYNKYNSSINYLALISLLLFLVQIFFLFKYNLLSYKQE